jgi:hypothetical protein
MKALRRTVDRRRPFVRIKYLRRRSGRAWRGYEVGGGKRSEFMRVHAEDWGSSHCV